MQTQNFVGGERFYLTKLRGGFDVFKSIISYPYFSKEKKQPNEMNITPMN